MNRFESWFAPILEEFNRREIERETLYCEPFKSKAIEDFILSEKH
jgi:hypothetical protein